MGAGRARIDILRPQKFDAFGSIRLVLAANSLDLLTDDLGALTSNDIRALCERFLLVPVADDRAMTYLHRLPKARHLAITEGDAVVEHAMYLHAEWQAGKFTFDEGKRFLVEGRQDSELSVQLATSSGLPARVCEWMAKYLEQPGRLGIQGRGPMVHDVDGMTELVVNAKMLNAHWGAYIEDDRRPRPTLSALARALEPLTAPQPVTVDDVAVRVFKLDYLEKWAVEKGGWTQAQWEGALVRHGLAEYTEE